MNEKWDSYWGKESNQLYWLQPDKAVVELMAKLDRIDVKTVLDLGCGIGRHSILFAEAGFEVTALDSSEEALVVLKKQVNEKGLKIRIIQDDYSLDLFPQESFDFIVAYNVIYHGFREKFKESVNLVFHWLKPSGQFFFTCPSRQDGKYGNGEAIAPNTYKPLNSITPGDIHYFSDEIDILGFTNNFSEVSKSLDEHYWDNNGVQQFNSYWQVLARK